MKMKLIPALLAVVVGGSVSAQDAPLQITRNHEAAGKTKPEVCKAARDWMAASFSGPGPTVEVFDVEGGKVIGRGGFTVLGYLEPYPASFTINMTCEDRRLAVTYSRFMFTSKGVQYPIVEDSMNKLRSKSESQVLQLDAALQQALR